MMYKIVNYTNEKISRDIIINLMKDKKTRRYKDLLLLKAKYKNDISVIYVFNYKDIKKYKNL